MPKKKNRESSSFGQSPLLRVMREASQAPDLRRKLIAKVEEFYKAKVILYFTSFTDENTQILDEDAEMLESILSVEHQGGKILMILNSPGGQALAAERIVNVCRSYSNNRFEVLVPHSAKSAATMICFGASVIHMSRTAELGPVDPQVPYRISPEQERPNWISADEYVRSYDKLVTDASGGKAKRLEPYLQQLARYDARYIEHLRSLLKLSEDISVRLLKSGMMSSVTQNAIRQKIQLFLAQRKTQSHGRMINFDSADACGLKVKEVGLRSAEWHAIWELYVRADWAVSRVCHKILETRLSAAQQ